MSQVVIDSGIFVASGFEDEPLNPKAIDLLSYCAENGYGLAAPRLLRSELVAVIRKAVFQKRIQHEKRHF